MGQRWLTVIFLASVSICLSMAQTFGLEGNVSDKESNKPVPDALVSIPELSVWAVADEKGEFVLNHLPAGKYNVAVQSMGYVTTSMPIVIPGDRRISLKMSPTTLKLNDVVVTSQRKTNVAATSYSIDRMALDNQQVLNVSNVTALLPGGKTDNNNLTDDERIALRSSGSEKGNAAFGTAIEIDGVRLDNNAMMDETTSASTRMIGTSDIESVDIVTGIPSVEYGDLSNGIVKVNLRKGASPFIVEGKVNQTTQQYALNKGFNLGKNAGVLNLSIEHARSFANIVSPHTAYQRNILSARYNRTFMRGTTPLTLTIGASGNVGGYNSESDPDNMLDSYTKRRDNLFRSNMELHWLLNRPWITNLMVKASLTYQDKQTESYTNASSASTQPYIHVTEQGYNIAEDYAYGNMNSLDVPSCIILGPTGYWYVRSYNDQKPLTWTFNLKGNHVKRFGPTISRLTLGADLKASGNKGKGTYYEELQYAPTWRPYRYDELPWLQNYAFYAEENITRMLGKRQTLHLEAGLREDLTHIAESAYGTASALAPRVNSKYTWRNENPKATWRNVTAHAGWGRSYKLPSFQVLYPAPSYSDVLAFTPGSTYDNRAYYAYYTSPTTALYNADLRWQHTDQTELGVEANLLGTKISLTAFHHRTRDPYTSVYQYSTYSYQMTSQSAVEKCGIASTNRRYSIDPQTGIVTVTDASGVHDPVVLASTEQRAYQTQRMYTNGSEVVRYGLEWVIDFAKIRALNTSIRIDGNYYHYRGLDETLFAGGSSGQSSGTSTVYPLVGYYRGSSSTSVATVASGNVSNGSLDKEVNLNATATIRIPRVRLIMMLRLESSLYNYSRPLCELSNGTRGIVLESASDYFGTPYDGTSEDKYVAVYPEYYSTWDNPEEKIPFAEKFEWAKDNDRTLYNQLARLVVKTNYAYVMNPNSLSAYYSLNFNITKEIGDHITVSFYANNFVNNMAKVTASRTGLESTLYNSGYIPKFYYGLSLKLKI